MAVVERAGQGSWVCWLRYSGVRSVADCAQVALLYVHEHTAWTLITAIASRVLSFCEKRHSMVALSLVRHRLPRFLGFLLLVSPDPL
jgi:hypothetical protein